MSNEPEPRLETNLPVRVFGMGADGRPFFQSAHARNISDHGARISGLEHRLKPGEVIGVQVGDRKGRCKVIWVVDAGPQQKIEVGVQVVEGQQPPWQKELQQAPPVEAPARIAPAEQNKRKFARQRVRFPIEIRDPQGRSVTMKTQSADINGRGCYVETLLPLPVGKVLEIAFWLDDAKTVTPAVVRTCDGGVGMGIEFTGLDDNTQQRLQRKVEALAAESTDLPTSAGSAF